MARIARIAPELPAANLPGAIAFYEKLGFALTNHTPQRDYAIVERDGIALHLFEDKIHRSSPMTSTYSRMTWPGYTGISRSRRSLCPED